MNSFHHQAVESLGEGLVGASPVARRRRRGRHRDAEACRFVVGVQWHPESFWDRPPVVPVAVRRPWSRPPGGRSDGDAPALPSSRSAPRPRAPAGPCAIQWEQSFDEALKKARSPGKPVMIDFWAEWCGWCHRLDKTTYVDPGSRSAAGLRGGQDRHRGQRAASVEVAVNATTSPPCPRSSSSPRRPAGLRVNGFQGPGPVPAHARGGDARRPARIMGWEEALESNPDDPAAARSPSAPTSSSRSYFDEARELLRRRWPGTRGGSPRTRRQTRMLLAIIEHVTTGSTPRPRSC